MRKLAFGQFAVIFGGCGIALLYVVTVLSQPIQIDDYNEIGKYEGETVTVEGAVVSIHSSDSGELYYMIYKNMDLLNVVIEINSNEIEVAEVNSKIKVTGEVQKNYRGKYEVVVTEGSSVKIIGEFEPVQVNWTDLEAHNNSYIKMNGTITHIDDYYGNKQKLNLRNGDHSIEAILSDPSVDLSIGNIVDAFGIIKYTSAGHRLYIYSPSAILITGQYDLMNVDLSEFLSEPEKYTDFPLRISGVVRYEPYTAPARSFYLGEQSVESSISIKVDLFELDANLILHKGDLVELITYTSFDEASLRYYLNPISIEINSRDEVYNLELEELMDNLIEYERAHINLSGYLHYVENNYYICDRAVFDNSSIIINLDLGANESFGIDNNSPSEPLILPTSKVRCSGRLIYNPERFYYIFTLEPNPNEVFWFPYF